MGEDLCKPCENFMKGDDKDLSQSQQDLNKKNKNDIDDIPQSSKLLLSLIKKNLRN